MKTLIYGAGPLGSVFAARLQEAGHKVSLLARGQRLADLQEYGVVLVDVQTKKQTVTRVNVIEELKPDDAYDLVLVIMRKNRALEILPTLAANQHTPNVLFLMNNAAGPEELVKALGRAGADGLSDGGRLPPGARGSLPGGREPGKKAMIPIGEADGRITPRLQQVGRILASMHGFDAELRTDMDAWLKTHVALLMPSLAPAMRAAGRDNVRMAHTRDAIVLAIRAIRGGFCCVAGAGRSACPGKSASMFGIPEPILVWGFQRRLVDPSMRVAMLEHAEAAQDEIKHLADEFIALKRQTSVPTPAMDRLYAYFDPATPLMPDGSAEIPMDWREVEIGLGMLAAAVAVLLASSWLNRRKS